MSRADLVNIDHSLRLYVAVFCILNFIRPILEIFGKCYKLNKCQRRNNSLSMCLILAKKTQSELSILQELKTDDNRGHSFSRARSTFDEAAMLTS